MAKRKSLGNSATPIGSAPLPTAALFARDTWMCITMSMVIASTLAKTYYSEDYLVQSLLIVVVLTIFSVVAFERLTIKLPTATRVASAVLFVGGAWLARYAVQAELWKDTGVPIWPESVLAAFTVIRFGLTLPALAALGISILAIREISAELEQSAPQRLKIVEAIRRAQSQSRNAVLAGLAAGWGNRSLRCRGACWALLACLVTTPILRDTAAATDGPGALNNRHRLIYAMSMPSPVARMTCSAVDEKTKYFILDATNSIVARTQVHGRAVSFTFELLPCIPSTSVQR